MSVLLIILVVLVILVIATGIPLSWGIGTYNTFVNADQDVQTQWSNVKTEYQRRADLIMNLVETVKLNACVMN